MNRKSARKPSLFPLFLAGLMALFLSFGLLRQNSHQHLALQTLQNDLALSQSTWQKIAEEKEALQATLTETKNALREAETTLAESTAKNAELAVQIDALLVQRSSLPQ